MLYNPRYPSVADLKKKAKSRIPKFAFDYLEGGCNEELNLFRNENDFDEILLKPRYLKEVGQIDTSVELFGKRYSAPFGISPIGLQGLINFATVLRRQATISRKHALKRNKKKQTVWYRFSLHR